GVELRHRRQAAVRVAGRSDHGGAHRRDSRARRRAVRRIPGAARDPDAAAGARAAHPAPPRSGGARRARPAAANERIWGTVRGVAAAGAGGARFVRDRGVFFGLTPIHFRRFDVYDSNAWPDVRSAHEALRMRYTKLVMVLSVAASMGQLTHGFRS